MPPHPLAIPQYSSNPYASLPPRTSTVQTFEYNQGRVGTTEVQQQNGQAIDPQSGTRMTSYPPLTLMQSGYSRPFYGNNPMHQGGDEQAERVAELDCPLVVTACVNYLKLFHGRTVKRK
ncbi:hypothetical protein F2Q70_00009642 [Brassica cretica]|uniref:Uncharacterized protein n=1 Tax=Brassica cretica TaxID=69181 RepID=A0A8S9J9G0_BRACR|nr:hypothetical protein F2Q68_00002657 [Brassica cretica]KAF2613881.1 hypothetical protein F2Q70_00009642 [Brassica cretica]